MSARLTEARVRVTYRAMFWDISRSDYRLLYLAAGHGYSWEDVALGSFYDVLEDTTMVDWFISHGLGGDVIAYQLMLEV